MNVLHVSPIGDQVSHDMSTEDADCVCGPRVEAVFRPDGSNGYVIVHNSLDGREAGE